MPRRNLVWLTGMGCLSLLMWAIAQGSIVPPRGPLQHVKGFPGADDDYAGLALMVDVWKTVRQNHAEEIDAAKSRRFWENAVGAGVQSLDVHSAFIPPRAREEFEKQTSAEFGGIGVEIRNSADGKRLLVVSPTLGSPADRAGIKAGDEIVQVDGEEVGALKPTEAARRIQGAEGTKVVLTVYRPSSNETFERTITRERIEIVSVLGDHRGPDRKWQWMLPGTEIAYVRLTSFTEKTSKELQVVLDHLREHEKPKAMILDLRHNGGGLLRSAVDVARMFIPRGKIVTVEGRTHTKDVYEADPSKTIYPDLPLAVLIDRESASASEILAAALQDAKRATIIGERSFGKGSVQNVFPLENGTSALKLTTAKYVRPDGRNIHNPTGERDHPGDWGVVPDEGMAVNLSRDEELVYWMLRRDRDIVRDPPTTEQLEKDVRLVLLAVGTAGGYHHSPEAFATGVAALQTSLMRLPRSFEDKVRDQAVVVLNKQIKRE